MKRIYLVEYEVRWNGDIGWTEHRINVWSNNADAAQAVAKAKTNALRQTFKDDSGEIHKVLSFRKTDVKVIATADI